MRPLQSILFLILGAGTALSQMQTTSSRNAEHYRWGNCCDGWFLVKNDRLHIIQEKMPPGSSEEPHLHRKAQQFFFVLKGEAALNVAGQEIVLKERDGASVPAGVVHQMRNRSNADVEFLVTSEPPSHGDRVPAPAQSK